MRVFQAGECVGFAPHTFPPAGHRLGRQDLDGDRPVQRGLKRPINSPGAPSADQMKITETRQCRGWSRGGWLRRIGGGFKWRVLDGKREECTGIGESPLGIPRGSHREWDRRLRKLIEQALASRALFVVCLGCQAIGLGHQTLQKLLPLFSAGASAVELGNRFGRQRARKSWSHAGISVRFLKSQDLLPQEGGDPVA